MSEPPESSDLDLLDRFVDRHIGPNHGEQVRMLETLGHTSLDEFIDAAVPSQIRDEELALPEALTEFGMISRMRELAARQHGSDLDDRHGLQPHPHAPCGPTQDPRESGLVHGLHALSARDLPGSFGDAPQFPDDGQRSHWHGAGERLLAR